MTVIVQKSSSSECSDKDGSFTVNSGTKPAVLPKGRTSTTNSGTKVAVLLGMNKCSSFLHPTLSLVSEQTIKNLKRSQGSQCGGEECMWLTGSFGLHRNSPQGLNISSMRVFDQIRNPEIPITLRPTIKIISNYFICYLKKLCKLYNYKVCI